MFIMRSFATGGSAQKLPKMEGEEFRNQEDQQQQPQVDIEFESSSSSGEDETPRNLFGAFDTMPCEGSDLEMDDSMMLCYEKLVEEEGLQHTIRSVPIGTRLEPLASVLDVVEKIVLMKPADKKKLVDIDTLVVRPSDLAVVGKVIEVFGPVEAPLYSVLCHPEYLSDNSFAPGTPFSYLPDQASLVDAVALRAQKITDADEVGGGEEFYSDDEAEAEAKRTRKPKRKLAADLEPGEIAE